MQSLSLKSLVVYIGIFAMTLVTGVSLSGLVSPSANEGRFEFGRGHRARDLKMEAELERMQELNEKLTERLELLEKRMEAPKLKVDPLPEVQAVPEIPGADKFPGVKVVPAKPQAKVNDQASF